jgi:hypothetical protein
VYLLFDAPSLASEPFEDRMARLVAVYGGEGCVTGMARLARSGSLKRTASGSLEGQVKVVTHTKVADAAAVEVALKDIDAKGGEGPL